jgi:hypothetical protein
MNDDSKISDIDPQYRTTEIGMSVIRDLFLRMKRIKREKMSPKPVGISEYSMVMIGDLLDRRRREVGEIRVYVRVPVNDDYIRFVIEWTKYVFGFWYRKELILNQIMNRLNYN